MTQLLAGHAHLSQLEPLFLFFFWPVTCSANSS